MRPVNLIPSDMRRGDGAPARAGGASYVVLGVLLAAVVAVTAMVLLGNDVKEKEAELASLETQRTEAEARAEALTNFTSFQSMKEARVSTVSQLAESRFDWERVMRELSLILPETVWLTNVTGTVAPEVTLPKTANLTLRSSITGPALALIGCARTQEDVAKLITAVNDIDGVTRVLVERSEKADQETAASGGTKSVNEDCRTRSYVAKFQLIAAFDGITAGASAPVAAAPAEPTTGAPGSETTTASATGETAVPEETEAQADANAKTSRARKAAGLVGAGDGG